MRTKKKRPPDTLAKRIAEIEWKQREVVRFGWLCEGIAPEDSRRHYGADADYVPVPWNAEAWWRNGGALRADHFAHVSQDDKLKLAYTPDARHGIEDRQIRTRPGKYLTRFFSSVLTSDEIRDYATAWAAQYERPRFKLATSADEIEEVYFNGPSSCMGEGHSFRDCPEYPTRVYAAGDLAVAYLGKIEDASARCVVWPERKLRSIIYGDEERLGRSLDAAGYNRGSLSGARLRFVPFDGEARVLVPYVDGEDAASYDGEYLIVGCGDVSLSSTDGYASMGEECERCGSRYDRENEGSTVSDEAWCESCVEHYSSWCEKCEEQFDSSNGEAVSVGDEVWCDDCARHHAAHCERCGDYVPQEDARSIGDEVWCDDCCESGAAFCERCEADVKSEDTVAVQVFPCAETWCDDCASGDGERCARCGDIFPAEDITDAHCADCREEKAEAIREDRERIGQGVLCIIAAISPRSDGIAYI